MKTETTDQQSFRIKDGERIAAVTITDLRGGGLGNRAAKLIREEFTEVELDA